VISESTATGWVEPLWAAVGELTELDLARLHRFEQTLCGLLPVYPVDASLDPGLRSQHLRQIRRNLAEAGHLAMAVAARHGGCGRPVVMQTLLQFICGYHDVDLRDSSGLGHGRLVAEHASPQVRDRWLPVLLSGAVPGIAITEPNGGSQVHATRTTATPAQGGTWAVTGTKTWISRLTEAALFCVFFTDSSGRLSAAVIDAASPGLIRRPIVPAGLSGWAWGELRLQAVTVRPCDILGEPGEGMRLLRDHFAHYRPLVAATALGAAAAVHCQTAAWLDGRRQAGVISDLCDNALITLGRTYAQINPALLAALTAQRLAEAGDPLAHLWGCAAKAHGVDVAYETASELALLVGAAGFIADSRTAKARRDLNALLYADGIHDSLYRAAGRSLTMPGRRASRVATPRPIGTAGDNNLSHA
jgi:alkylation response protein AidB-like acyl-CoA dehydrogenase